ncbi:hypothetical protein [Shewanella sp. Scap07]|uniref:hypothetical protein n=1 Tax=Shewanella sp. Scap07 TaxID=2589987 RepID=UPI0015C0647B|nr:hypothetical protein [Shewanella sp. Scap07]
MAKDDLLSAYGDGWYDGFLAATKFAKTKYDDLVEITTDDVLRMSEDAESNCQLGRKA